MSRMQQRLGLLAVGMAALGGATALVLSAFNDNLVFFYSPSELKAKGVSRRIAGCGSAVWSRRKACHAAPTGAASRSASPMARADVGVVYQGCCCRICSARGKAPSPRENCAPTVIFAASSVLAKHDENYMPREVVDALKKSGHWQEGGAVLGAVTPAQAGSMASQKQTGRSMLSPGASSIPLSRE